LEKHLFGRMLFEMRLRSRVLSASVFLLCWFVCADSAASTNIVFNGDFAAGIQSPPGPGTDTVANGWTLLPAVNTGFNIRNINGTFYAAFMSTATAAEMAGGQMNGIGVPNGNPDQDCFYQPLTVIAGKRYTVSFSVQVTGAVGNNTLLVPQWNWAPQVGTQANMMDRLYGSYDDTNGKYSPAAGTGSAVETFTETAPVGDGVSAGSTEVVNLMFHGSDVTGGAILLSNVVVAEEFTPGMPAILSGGVVPLYSSATTIQPGSWISIYGGNLASGTAEWSGDFPTSLGGTSVTINNKLGYLSYVSPGQINMQAPDDTATGSASVVVTTASGTATANVTLGEFGPAFSLLDGKHVAAIILRSDGSGAYGDGAYDIAGPTGTSLGYSTVAAKPGDALELFGVGFGSTNPTIPAGKPYFGAAPTTSPVQLVINNVAVAPEFAGLSSAGLYQINLSVPEGLGTGDFSLQAIVGGVQTSSVLISLQQ
jgi:uncharacterized protein (TIGR03437 family)